jgi:hypothetical protein
MLNNTFNTFNNSKPLNIGILENLEPNHVQTLNALVKSYATLKNVNIVVFVSQKTLSQIKGLGLEHLAKFKTQKETISNQEFLKEIENFSKTSPFYRFHICSTKDYYKDYSNFKPNTNEIVLHIHNTDVWFENNLKDHTTTLLYDLKNDESRRKKINIIGKFFKNLLIRSYYTKKILIEYSKNYKLLFIVQNKNIAKNVVGNRENTIIFPFSCFEDNSKTKDYCPNGKNLTIGICGMVSQERRNYLDLFEELKKSRDKEISQLEFLLLGYINPREKESFLKEISTLQNLGIKVYHVSKNNTCLDYQRNMENCDILLNLVKLKKGARSIYSKTKESGMIGDMISSAKPGLVPKGYYIEAPFKASTLEFDNMENLLTILKDLLVNPTKLVALKEKAYEVSNMFTPIKLCKTLIKN